MTPFAPPTASSISQMDEAMARQGLLLDPELLANGDPAVLQILAQTYQVNQVLPSFLPFVDRLCSRTDRNLQLDD